MVSAWCIHDCKQTIKKTQPHRQFGYCFSCFSLCLSLALPQTLPKKLRFVPARVLLFNSFPFLLQKPHGYLRKSKNNHLDRTVDRCTIAITGSCFAFCCFFVFVHSNRFNPPSGWVWSGHLVRPKHAGKCDLLGGSSPLRAFFYVKRRRMEAQIHTRVRDD